MNPSRQPRSSQRVTARNSRLVTGDEGIQLLLDIHRTTPCLARGRLRFGWASARSVDILRAALPALSPPRIAAAVDSVECIESPECRGSGEAERAVELLRVCGTFPSQRPQDAHPGEPPSGSPACTHCSGTDRRISIVALWNRSPTRLAGFSMASELISTIDSPHACCTQWPHRCTTAHRGNQHHFEGVRPAALGNALASGGGSTPVLPAQQGMDQGMDFQAIDGYGFPCLAGCEKHRPLLRAACASGTEVPVYVRMGSSRRLSFRCEASFRCLLLRRCPVGEAIPDLPADVQSAAGVLSEGKRTLCRCSAQGTEKLAKSIARSAVPMTALAAAPRGLRGEHPSRTDLH